ncbi:MAG: hypothetical protein FWD30_04050, partial [Dehalococcoidia bacterium]|nr:hypothetical protein [Dehalococcoidia bacterium]
KKDEIAEAVNDGNGQSQRQVACFAYRDKWRQCLCSECLSRSSLWLAGRATFTDTMSGKVAITTNTDRR